MLFDNKKSMNVDLPADVSSMGDLVTWIKNNLIKEKHDMFVVGETLRPGVLVLINDVDWELENTTKYVLSNDDHVSFISMLHGG